MAFDPMPELRRDDHANGRRQLVRLNLDSCFLRPSHGANGGASEHRSFSSRRGFPPAFVADTPLVPHRLSNSRRMWTPSRDTRIAFVVAGLLVLATALVVSFFGPVAVLTLGPQPAGANLELQGLDFAVIASLASVGLAVWRGSGGAALAAVGGGVLAAGLGLYLAFGVWQPTLHGAFYAPFTLQGALLLQWGVFVLLFGLLAVSKYGRPFSHAVQPQTPAR
jgi:hypothetical protein